MPKKPDIQRLIEMQKLLLEFRAIKRMIYLPGKLDQQENDTEHSYDLTMAAWFLASHFPELDRDKVIRLALAHDLVEIHTGDTFAYGDAEHIASKKEREAASAAKLAKEWSDFPDLNTAITEYETGETNEAKFVYALDKIMPALMNILGDGYAWHNHNITLEDFRAEKEHKVSVSPEILPYYQQLYDLLRSHPELMPAKTK